MQHHFYLFFHIEALELFSRVDWEDSSFFVRNKHVKMDLLDRFFLKEIG